MSTFNPSCGDMLDLMRRRNPLVQCITNDVSMNIVANVLLAVGASPAMVSAEEEAGEFASISSAVTINIGTLSAGAVPGMKAAARAARSAGRPWVLDPVAHHATSFRRKVVAELLELQPTIIRGNASEIRALAGEQSQGQGVDSGDSSLSAQEAAARLATRHGCIVAVTGEKDVVTDGSHVAIIDGGSPLMPRVTALGCALTCMTGAFAAIDTDKVFEATIAALALFSVCGEEAGRDASGPGSFPPIFLDRLSAIEPQHLDEMARISMQ